MIRLTEVHHSRQRSATPPAASACINICPCWRCERASHETRFRFDPKAAAKKLLREGRSGALATLMAGTGDPYCSLVNVATAADGAPLLLISRLAVHTRNILADPRVSLMLDERKQGDPLEGARVMLMGTAAVTEDAEARRRYLLRQPEAEMFVGFKDFSFYQMTLKGAHLVAGFGRIVDLEPVDVLTDVSDAGALVGAEPRDPRTHERRPRRCGAALCNQAARRARRRLALRRLRSGRPRTAEWSHCAAPALPASACVRPGVLRQVLKRMAEEARAMT